MNIPAPETLLDCAVEAARRAGQHALAHSARRQDVLRRAAHDVKLALDVECQQQAEAVIRRAFPDHSVLGEEGRDAQPAAVEWIVDPIDGTVNFSHGLPGWCCSVAVRAGGETLAGAVFAPRMDELFTATRDGPARLNGAPIRVSGEERLDHAMVLTGLCQPECPKELSLSTLGSLSARIQKARILGAAALDLCYVACGRAEGYLETNIYLWDVAAGELILRRAGGQTAVLRDWGDCRMAFLGTNAALHQPLKAWLEESLA
jgi:myo-inositol-1(or 4)-monophosphatase